MIYNNVAVDARALLALALATVGVVLGLALPGVAAAAQVYVPTGTFSGPGSGPGELAAPKRAAVEQSTGNIFVADSDNGRVQVFKPNGDQLTEFGSGELDHPFGIAIRVAAGQTLVYVSDPATQQIVRYSSDEQPTPSFSADPAWTSPKPGNGSIRVGSFAAPLAVDPTNGNLLVADPADDFIQRYSDTGTILDDFDGSDSPAGPFDDLLDVATDSAGHVYAVSAFPGGPEATNSFISGQSDGTSPEGQSRVERFSPGGSYQLTLADLTRPATVATSPADDAVAVSADQDNIFYDGQPSLHVYDASGDKLDDVRMGEASYGTTVNGLAFAPSGGGVYAVNDFGLYGGAPYGTPGMTRLGLADEPTAVMGAVTNVTARSADFAGTVNPGGHDTKAHYEISTDGGSSWTALDEQTVCEVASPGDCAADVPVPFSATGLSPNTSYDVRLVAASEVGTVNAASASFSTDQAAPTVQTGGAKRQLTSAVLNGRINPHSLQTTYHFEYGTSPGVYTEKAPLSQDADAGPGSAATPVTRELTGLTPATTYYYRLVATNAVGTTVGTAAEVTTLASGQFDPDTYFTVGTFSGLGVTPGLVTEASRVAVHDASGEVYVVDTANNRVQVFAPEGDSVTYLTDFGADVLSAPVGIAIDQSNGDVYVSSSGSNEIVRFTRHGGDPPTFTRDLTYTSPAAGPGPGELSGFAAPLAVDRATHDLWIGDPGDRLIQHYHAGGFVNEFDGATSGVPFGAIDDLATDGDGNVIVVGDSRVERFSPTGAHQLSLGDSSMVAGRVAVDPHSGHVIVMRYYGWDTGGVRLYVFDGETELSNFTLPPPPGQEFNGPLSIVGGAVDGGSSGRFYVFTNQLFGCCGATSGYVLEPGARPSATINTPVVGASSVQLTGTVNPTGDAARWRFEYRTEGGDWTQVPQPFGEAGDGVAPVPVEVEAADLQSNTTYEVRLVVRNRAGEGTSDVREFTTGVVAPVVHTAGSDEVAATAATFAGRVNPRGVPAKYWFEYGTQSGSYTASVPAAHDASAGSGTELIGVSQRVADLQPSTTYYYRLVVDNGAGTHHGEERSLTTGSGVVAPRYEGPRIPGRGFLPDDRGWELVSQADLGGNAITSAGLALDGDRATYYFEGGAPGSTGGSATNIFTSARTDSGWVSKAFSPPREISQRYGLSILGISADHRSMMFRSAPAFVLRSPPIIGRLGVDDLSHPKTLLEDPMVGGQQLQGYNDRRHSEDLSVLVLRYGDATALGGAPGPHLYELGSGNFSLVDRLPDGTLPCTSGSLEENINARWVADDGSRIFFRASQSASDCDEKGLYVRRPGPGDDYGSAQASTERLDKPLAGERNGAVGLQFVQADQDGTQAIFTSVVRLATDAGPVDTNDATDVYRWTEGSGVRCLTCAALAPAEVGNVMVSSDTSRVYFTSRNVLVSGEGRQGQNNLYLRDGDGLTFVATMGEIDGSASSRLIELTKDGRVAVFRSADPSLNALTDSDSGSCDGGTCYQLYRYDAGSGSLSCISCPPSGAAVANADVGSFPVDYGPPGVMSENGDMVVFSTSAPLAKQDGNGTADLYRWKDGEAELITDGTTAGSSPEVRGVSADGRSIAFVAAAALTPEVANPHPPRQLYVARVGGGFAEPGHGAPCQGDSCQGAATAPPGVATAASIGFRGPGDAQAAPDRKRSSVSVSRVKAVTGTVATLSVRVPSAGRISVAGGAVAKTGRSAAKAATYKVRVSLNAKAKRTLRQRGTLSATVRVTFAPKAGQAVATNVRLSFKRAKTAAKRAVSGPKGGR